MDPGVAERVVARAAAKLEGTGSYSGDSTYLWPPARAAVYAYFNPIVAIMLG
jgi:hypothetical protein